MATVKQVLAAISQDGLMGPNQKKFVVEAIKRAETWINLSTPAKPRKITNAKDLMSLERWENFNGRLSGLHHMATWIRKNGLSLEIIDSLIEEFRTEMLAKGKEYANFKMAFQTYLTKGYLSKNIEQAKRQDQTIIHSKGISL